MRKYIRHSGPYKVVSNIDGTLTIYPDWHTIRGKPGWKREGEADEEAAGGPGLLDRTGFAEMLEEWFNG